MDAWSEDSALGQLKDYVYAILGIAVVAGGAVYLMGCAVLYGTWDAASHCYALPLQAPVWAAMEQRSAAIVSGVSYLLFLGLPPLAFFLPFTWTGGALGTVPESRQFQRAITIALFVGLCATLVAHARSVSCDSPDMALTLMTVLNVGVGLCGIHMTLLILTWRVRNALVPRPFLAAVALFIMVLVGPAVYGSLSWTMRHSRYVAVVAPPTSEQSKPSVLRNLKAAELDSDVWRFLTEDDRLILLPRERVLNVTTGGPDTPRQAIESYFRAQWVELRVVVPSAVLGLILTIWSVRYGGRSRRRGRRAPPAGTAEQRN
jgi:hypothetical protein